MSGLIHATLPWAEIPDAVNPNVKLPHTLDPEDYDCFTCRLPECDQGDPCCPHDDDNGKYQRRYLMAYRAARAIEEGEVQAALQEMEAVNEQRT